ncbi:GntR family transcriptional regulator [Alkalicoccus daliensis]|uniref:DNA-binding transcriptional regulator YhcF, GntR family n=1 Tax=Alkalicoccus daliensis TaxID=745820 RepID=A0A1G9ZDP1_9BACI|nr:GntR family transcriptional regulator [Alkalicoccus daliensis]SDN19295.1 DNA-binding transcriptional regulator YhcF, GntR family [Alkalicoccus daliensis]
MNGAFQDGSPIFHQVEKRISDNIVSGKLTTDDQVPSTNQFAKHYQINPATAAKGINRLVDKGILYKKRGVGMFVASGARKKLVAERQQLFYEEFILPMLEEAEQLDISVEEVKKMIDGGI